MRVSRRGLPPGPFFSKFLLQMARKEEWTGGAFDNATSVDVEIDPHRRRLGLQKKCTCALCCGLLLQDLCPERV